MTIPGNHQYTPVAVGQPVGQVDDGAVSEVSASINGNQVVLENPPLQLPIAIRYAWKNGSEASLFNSAGLPASTFYIELK